MKWWEIKISESNEKFSYFFKVEDPELAPSQPDCGFYPAPPGLIGW